MESLNMSLDVPCCRHDMWTYLVLYSVKWKYWIDPCRENEILVYMPTGLINGMFQLVPDAKHDMSAYLILYSVKLKYWNGFVSKVFGFVFGKMKVLEWLCRENKIKVYLPTTLINVKFELVPWCETWYVNLLGFVFGKMKVLECPLSRKRDFNLYGYNFDKYGGWTCTLI